MSNDYFDESLNLHSGFRKNRSMNIPDFSPGSVFGEFTILCELGQGGMGVVYRVRHNKLDKEYALKLLISEENEQFNKKDFLAEAQKMARLEHPGVVRINAFNETRNICWIQMELANGDGQGNVTLQQLANSHNGRLCEKVLVRFMKPILEAVAYGHGKGVIHQDLKPSNILLFKTDYAGLIPKIADFGLARLQTDSRDERESDTGTQQAGERKSVGEISTNKSDGIQGTLGYMSPEQEEGKTADKRSDVYSLGLMIYRLLTGKKKPLGLPSQVCSDLSGEWDQFVQKALDDEPSRRFQDAGEMLEAFNELAETIHKTNPDTERVTPGDFKKSDDEKSLYYNKWTMIGTIVCAIFAIFSFFWAVILDRPLTELWGQTTQSIQTPAMTVMLPPPTETPLIAKRSTDVKPTIKPKLIPSTAQPVIPTPKPTAVVQIYEEKTHRTVVVDASKSWQSSGINLRSNDTVEIEATGTWKNAPDSANWSPDGYGSKSGSGYLCPGASEFSLVGRIGNTNCFKIGKYLKLDPVGTDGELMLGMNDKSVYLRDNRGRMTVRVVISDSGSASEIRNNLNPTENSSLKTNKIDNRGVVLSLFYDNAHIPDTVNVRAECLKMKQALSGKNLTVTVPRKNGSAADFNNYVDLASRYHDRYVLAGKITYRKGSDVSEMYPGISIQFVHYNLDMFLYDTKTQDEQLLFSHHVKQSGNDITQAQERGLRELLEKTVNSIQSVSI